MPEQLEKQDLVAEMGHGKQVPGELPEDQRQPPELEDGEKALRELQGCCGGHELGDLWRPKNPVVESWVNCLPEEMEGELGPPFELPGSDTNDSRDHG